MYDENDTCPICKKSNNCGACYQNEGNALRCWCNALPVSNEMLAMLPSDLQGTTCICRSCIEKFNTGELTKAQLFLQLKTDR